MSADSDPVFLDLSDFEDRQQALDRASNGCPKGYTNVAKKHMTGHQVISMKFLLFG
ncbi:hypothetical protein [Amycolatopsis pithecellobii]|uniref:Uncharacterized protein n=1 Tax=Amycolatopsis pithecellobii TaxID=664692 RepID=A0A6N7ZD94_9PSEU|nr:hypothetical protein [Amycolatopsis pithecellobii]MTD59656.1 hypothetical protein [Amycolatopsis pithecellobii]